jgi:hypothetical protein
MFKTQNPKLPLHAKRLCLVSSHLLIQLFKARKADLFNKNALKSQSTIDEFFSQEASLIDAALPFIRDKLKKMLKDYLAPQDDKMVNLDAIIRMQQHLAKLKKKRERDRLCITGINLIKEL